jgi:hypothetical protein
MCFWPRARRRPFKLPRQEQPYIRLQSLQHERPDMSTQLLRPETPVICSQLSQHEQADSLPDLFQHEPLDLKTPSIRLIQIHPAHHSEDRMRCTLRLASIDTKYTCLSYVWGDEHTGDWIHLNNMRFFVRQNLLDFLRSARRISDLTSQWLWIDALCIDQTNTPERQHQVQQMGRIYAGAKEVVSWLGIQKDIITLFRDRPENGRRKVDGVVALSLSRYWWRAWIIQEIILGPHVKLMAGTYMLPLDELPPYHTAMSRKFNHYGAIQTRVLHMRKLLQAREQSEVTLICLLHHFQYQQCHVERDRIFSLLGLCKSGLELKVDYSIPDYDLVQNVLDHCGDSFCLCAVHTVSEALNFEWIRAFHGPMGHTTLTLPIHQGNRKCSQHGGDYDYRKNSDCIRHRGGDCPEKDTHSIKLYKRRSTGEPKMKITINLHHLCSMYCDELEIEVHSTMLVIIYQHSGQSREQRKYWEWPSGLLVQMMENGQSCRIVFPLSFWFWTASFSDNFRDSGLNILQDRCCHRITCPGEQRSENCRKPRLELLQDTQHIGKFFKLPREVDMFLDPYWRMQYEKTESRRDMSERDKI